MRVLITTSTFPITEDDGLPRFVYDLAMALSELCRVTVLAPHHPGAERRATVGDLTVRRFQYAWPARVQQLAYGSGMRENWRAGWPARIQAPAYMAALVQAVRKLGREEPFDVINAHWLVPQGLGSALALGRRRSIAHVVTVHAGDLSLMEKAPLGRQAASFVAGRTDLFLPVSGHVGRRLQRLTGRRLPMAVQSMGVDYRRFSACPVKRLSPLPFDGRFILFVGRLVEKKGAVCLLDAMARLLPEFPETGLVMIGTGPLAGRLKARADALGIAARVRFMGRRGHAEIIPYLHACRVLAVPSIVDAGGETEGMPTVLIEAMAAGCRVVASRVPGISDLVVHGHNGWLARPGDARDLAQKVAQALGCQDDRVAQRAGRSARNLDWRQVADSYSRHFQAALSRREGSYAS